MKAGVFYNRNLRQAQQPVAFNATINFGRNVNNPLDTGYAFSNAMFGVFNQYQEATAQLDMSTRKFSITPGKFAASGSADLPVIFPDGRRRTGFLAMQWPQGKFKP